MSNLQIIAELCEICAIQARIISSQADVLAQHGAAVMEEERADADRRMTALLGHDEAPDKFAD